MKITKKIFWNEALKGGVIIGLVWVVFNIISMLVTGRALGIIINILEFLGISTLIYIFTKKVSKMADEQDGFPYPRCVAFVVSMMLFAGTIMGMYVTIKFNFINNETITESINAAIARVQNMNMYADINMDAYSRMMRAAFTSPFIHIPIQIISCIVMGIIPGLITSAFAKKDPDVFAREDDEDDD